MRLDTASYLSILSEKQLSNETVWKAIGLSEKTYFWILNNGYTEIETLERVADAIGCPVGDILNPDYEGYSENVIEWVKDEDRATLSLSQRRTISKVKQLAESYPEECQILKENKDGSLYAHVPVKWIRIAPPKKLSEETKKILAERLSKK